ncbi:MAG: hypothetical protein A3F46_00825 [Legionellales bacterium RIFCSPHIGHO2_12_FULL_42_9]|nr:MAG: hypothetical protein A3F46_00825 [Legionellales bacterium RIFCSPHIGHO2_12_FULL_42_9]
MNQTNCANIIETKEYSVVYATLNTSDENTLVVFDVDEVLLTPSDQILQYKTYANEKLGLIAEQVGLPEFWNLMSILFMQRPVQHVDLGFVSLLRELQNRRVKVIALTNCSTSGFGQMASMKDWRLNELKNLDYHFDHSWQNTPEKIFEDLPTEVADTFPIFDQGVLFTNNVPKGQVLQSFLDHYEYHPSKIVFIDDRLDYINSVGEIAKTAAIPYVGIHYTAADIGNNSDICEKRVSLQLDVLVKEKIWLSDKEADERIENTMQIN